MIEIQIPQELIAWAKLLVFDYKAFTPYCRTAGFKEEKNKVRGEGDLLDFIAKWTFSSYLAKADCIHKIDITCGTGDDSDGGLLIHKIWKSINIKASQAIKLDNNFDNMNLIIKQEEIEKAIGIYIQCFVHLNEPKQEPDGQILSDLSPHIHVVGYCDTESDLWQTYKNKISSIRDGSGNLIHQGIKIPVSQLSKIEDLINQIDKKPNKPKFEKENRR